VALPTFDCEGGFFDDAVDKTFDEEVVPVCDKKTSLSVLPNRIVRRDRFKF
jgi:hypothetical protein